MFVKVEDINTQPQSRRSTKSLLLFSTEQPANLIQVHIFYELGAFQAEIRVAAVFLGISQQNASVPSWDTHQVCLTDQIQPKKVQARSAVPFAVELLPGFQVDGTWNVPTYFDFGWLNHDWPNEESNYDFFGT